MWSTVRSAKCCQLASATNSTVTILVYSTLFIPDERERERERERKRSDCAQLSGDEDENNTDRCCRVYRYIRCIAFTDKNCQTDHAVLNCCRLSSGSGMDIKL